MQTKRRKSERNGDEYELPKRIGIVFSDVKREYFPTEAQYITEKDADEDAKLIGDYLATLGITVYLYPGNEQLPFLLYRINQRWSSIWSIR